MSELVDLFRTKAEDLIASINRAGGLKATVEALRKQMEVSDRRRAVARAKADIKRTHEQITDMVTAVGLQVVALHEAKKLQVAELDPLCSQIVELRSTVRELETDLARLEAEAEAAVARDAGEHCRACGKPIQPGLRFCPHCGVTLAPPAPTCPHCSSPVRAQAKFCSRCGRPIDGAAGSA